MSVYTAFWGVMMTFALWAGFVVVLIVRAEAWRARQARKSHGFPIGPLEK